MTRHIVLGNQSFLINIDRWFQVRDIYFFPRRPGKSPNRTCPTDRNLY